MEEGGGYQPPFLPTYLIPSTRIRPFFESPGGTPLPRSWTSGEVLPCQKNNNNKAASIFGRFLCLFLMSKVVASPRRQVAKSRTASAAAIPVTKPLRFDPSGPAARSGWVGRARRRGSARAAVTVHRGTVGLRTRDHTVGRRGGKGGNGCGAGPGDRAWEWQPWLPQTKWK